MTIENVKQKQLEQEERVYFSTRGVCKSFDSNTGYGFLHTMELPDEDIFIHFSQLLIEGKKELVVGDVVEFLYSKHEKGYRAYQVRKIETKSLEENKV